MATATHPTRLDHVICAGEDYQFDLTFKNTDATPMNLTGMTITCQIYDVLRRVRGIARITIPDPAAGKVYFLFDRHTTQAFSGPLHCSVRVLGQTGLVQFAVDGSVKVRQVQGIPDPTPIAGQVTGALPSVDGAIAGGAQVFPISGQVTGAVPTIAGSVVFANTTAIPGSVVGAAPTVSGAVNLATPPTGTIAITNPVDNQFYKQNNGFASFTANGTLNVTGGDFVGVRCRWNGGAWVNGTVVGNNWSATLTNQPLGQGTFEVEFINSGSTVRATKSLVSVAWVFLGDGQSNMSGRGTNSQTYTSVGGLKALMYDNAGAYRELADPWDGVTGQAAGDPTRETSSAGGSYILPLASYFIAQGLPVAFVPTAKGGSSSAQHLPSGSNIRDTTTMFGRSLVRAELFGGVNAILWHQGETDADNSVAAGTTTANLRSIAETYKAQLNCQTFMVRLQPFTGPAGIASRETVIGAINAAIDASPAIEPGPDFGITTLVSDDDYHLKGDAKLAIAANLWWAYLSQFFNLPGKIPIPDITPAGTVTITSPASGASAIVGSGVTVSGAWSISSGRMTGKLQSRVNGGAWTPFSGNWTATSGTYSTSVIMPLVAGTATIEISLTDNPAVIASTSVAVTSVPEDAVVTAFNDRFTAVGGTLPTQQRNAHNTLVTDLKNANLWAKCDLIATYAGADFNGCNLLFKKPAGMGSDLLTLSGYISTDYAASSGLTGGTGKFINSGYSPSALAKSESTLGLWAYLTANIGSGNQTLIGQQNTPTSPSGFSFLGQYSAGANEGGVIAGASANIAGNNTNNTGLIGTNADSSRAATSHLNASNVTGSIATGTWSSLGLTGNYYFGAMNGVSTGAASNNFTGRQVLSIITDGLTTAEAATLKTIAAAFITNMGR